jgi:hypothetical protein
LSEITRQTKPYDEKTLTDVQANLSVLIFLVPLIFLYLLPYYLLWPAQFTKTALTRLVQARDSMNSADWMILLVVMLAGVLAHELLHGIGWGLFAKRGWQSIRFGFKWHFLTPYCHCIEPLPARAYRVGSILPGFVLGFLPAIYAIATGNPAVLAFAFFFTFSAGGDFLILWKIRMLPADVLLQDHPDKIGCIIMR